MNNKRRYTNNSIGLLSDACHMLFDSTSIAFGLYAVLVRNLLIGRSEMVPEVVSAVVLPVKR